MTTVTDPSILPFNSVVSPGATVYGGFQYSFSNAKTPQDLAGPFVDYGGGGGLGLGVGGDTAVGAGSQGQLIAQTTVTVGGGAGALGHGLTSTLTYVDAICQ